MTDHRQKFNRAKFLARFEEKRRAARFSTYRTRSYLRKVVRTRRELWPLITWETIVRRFIPSLQRMIYSYAHHTCNIYIGRYYMNFIFTECIVTLDSDGIETTTDNYSKRFYLNDTLASNPWQTWKGRRINELGCDRAGFHGTANETSQLEMTGCTIARISINLFR